jgi:drug/metabolite transporter (DMT)-like permease
MLGGIAGPVLLLFGLRNAAASSVSLWLNMELVATAVLGAIFFRDHLGKTGWAGVLTALASSIVLTMHEGPSGIIPAAFIGLACLCWGFDNHFTALIDGISAVQSTFIKGLFAGTVNTVIGSFLPGPDPAGVLILYSLLLGGLSYGLSIVLYIMSAQKLGATRSQVIFSSAPFFGVVFSIVFLSESISPIQAASMILFTIAIALLIVEHHEHRHKHHAIEHTHIHNHNDLHHIHTHEEDVSYHEHSHQHDVTTHSHPHWPDLHHRHIHKD